MIRDELKSLWQQTDRSQFRKFGFTLATVFILLAAYLWYISSELFIYSLSLSILLVVLAALKPELLKYPYYLWMSFALVLGSIMSRVILILIYMLLFMPVGIILRLLKKDPLHRALLPEKESYWIKRDRTFTPESVEKQY